MENSADVYDCFMFYNELDLLELRLNELDDVADYFVLVEGTRTHQGDEKELYYQNNMDRFEAFEDRIIHVIVDEFPNEIDSAWEREHYSRNAISEGLQNCSTDDIVMISDVDEIPRPAEVERHSRTTGLSVLGMRLYYYFFNCMIVDRMFPATVIGRYHNMPAPQEAREIAMQHVNLDILLPMDFEQYPFWLHSYLTAISATMRQGQLIRVVPDAGWHFSFLTDIQGIIRKLEAYPHTEYNRPEYKDPERIREKVASGEDIFDRDYEMEFMDLDGSYPDYLLDNRTDYNQYIA